MSSTRPFEGNKVSACWFTVKRKQDDELSEMPPDPIRRQ